ncbi:hypothetical protein AAC387_Pa03g2908 [Persea americana]
MGIEKNNPVPTPVMVNHGEKPEKFNGTEFKRWQQKMLFYLTTLNLARFLHEEAPALKADETDKQVVATVEAWKHTDFLCHEINDSPVEEVRLTVPVTDDKTLPVVTFRTWVIGFTSCILVSFMTRFFVYRQNQVSITSECIQILILPLGKLMAATLPAKPIRVPGTRWAFSMNPGPFNMKEHLLITIFGRSGIIGPTSTSIMIIMKVFYHRKFSPLIALLLGQTSLLIGYGYAGMLMKFLVDSPKMWWPSAVAEVSFYRTLHEANVRIKGKVTRFQFFIIASVTCFAYYIIPNYFFPSITSLSIVCWIWKNSVTAQQIGSGRQGLGLGSFVLDYSSIYTYVGSPFTIPTFAIINTMVGFVLYLYIVIPIAYWTNSQNAKRFPLFSSRLFDADGREYNVSRVLDENDFTLDPQKFKSYSEVYLSTIFAYKYAFTYAVTAAALTHTVLYYGRSVWNQFKETYNNQQQEGDIHNRLMRNYKTVPQWWFYAILLLSSVLAILMCIFVPQLQLPPWGFVVALITSVLVTLTSATFYATTSQMINPADFQDLAMGYLLPGRPLALKTFSAYNGMSVIQAISLLSDFKLGHYMKIPPRSIFTVQVIGQIVSSSVHVGVTWWLLSTIKNLCEPDKLPKGSPWTCPYERIAFDITVQSGVIGPAQLFVPHGRYGWTYVFFILGIIATVVVWKLSRAFPHNKWIKNISVPILLLAPMAMPPTGPMHYWTWGAIGLFFNFYVFKRHKEWWANYNYLLSAALNVGPAFSALVQSAALQLNDIYGVNWWGLDLGDHCPLASCPTAKGVVVKGCPVFH